MNMILSRVSGKERTDFVVKILEIMVTLGSASMSEDELKAFKKKLRAVINGAKPGEGVADNVVDIEQGAG
jgi:hypothetical protein